MKQTETNPTPTPEDEARALLLAKANKHRENALRMVNTADEFYKAYQEKRREASQELRKAHGCLTDGDDIQRRRNAADLLGNMCVTLEHAAETIQKEFHGGNAPQEDE